MAQCINLCEPFIHQMLHSALFHFNCSMLLHTVKGEVLKDSQSCSPEVTSSSTATQLPSADQASLDKQRSLVSFECK